MSPMGALGVSVLGTEPALYGLPASDAPAPLDAAAQQDRLAALQARIKAATEPPISK